MIHRRRFLACLAALPFVGRIIPKRYFDLPHGYMTSVLDNNGRLREILDCQPSSYVGGFEVVYFGNMSLFQLDDGTLTKGFCFSDRAKAYARVKEARSRWLTPATRLGARKKSS